MARKGKVNQESATNEKNREILWTKHGIDDVYYQREAHVNFWTILGGIAVAALLTQVSNLAEQVQIGNWHLLLYFLTAVTLIANSWVQNLWGGLVLKAQVTILHTLLLLFNLIFLSIMCLYITEPMIYFSSASFFVLSAILLQIYIMKTGGWIAFKDDRIKGIKIVLRVYLVFLILCIIATAHLFWLPSIPAEIGWGIFALLASCISMIMQHNGMNQERKELGIP